jgi:CubicO group peptidase (beta-lactamase class C family)
MGGVSGHAGLFSTADDLAVFVQMLLNGGSANDAKILKPVSIEEMTARQQTVNGAGWWGLGWEIAPLFNSNRDELVPARSFGHSGFTGTSIWIDPDSKSYVIILTNRVHPRGAGDVKPLRTDVLRFVTAALGQLSSSQSMMRRSQPKRPSKR